MSEPSECVASALGRADLDHRVLHPDHQVHLGRRDHRDRLVLHRGRRDHRDRLVLHRGRRGRLGRLDRLVLHRGRRGRLDAREKF